MKDDANRMRPLLVLRDMNRALEEVCQVAEYGAKKYSPSGWLNTPEGQTRYADAMMRHVMAHLRGERVDPESGKLHMAHAAWDALAVLELMLRRDAAARFDIAQFETLRPAGERVDIAQYSAQFETLAKQWAEDLAAWTPRSAADLTPKPKVDPAADLTPKPKVDPAGSESSTAALEAALRAATAACPDKRYEQAREIGLLTAGVYKGLQVMLRLKLRDRTATACAGSTREALAKLREGVSHFYDAALTEAVTPAWTVQDALASLRKDPAVAKVLDARTVVPVGWGTALWLRHGGQTVGSYALADLQKDAALRRRVRRAIKAYASEVQGQKQAEQALEVLTRDEPLLAEAVKRKLLRVTFEPKAQEVRISLFDRRGQELFYASHEQELFYTNRGACGTGIGYAVRDALATARQHPHLLKLLETVLPRPATDKDLRRGRHGS